MTNPLSLPQGKNPACTSRSGHMQSCLLYTIMYTTVSPGPINS